MSCKTAFTVMLASSCFGILGCGGPSDGIVPVEGVVKMDGEPLQGALLTFAPITEDGVPRPGTRPSYGRTDEDGWYELVYTNTRNGAVTGRHLVSISTHQERAGAGYGEEEQGEFASTEERVPAQYNANSELIEEVEPGGCVIDFDLTSEGEIIILDDSQ